MVELLLLDTRTLAFVSSLGGLIMAVTMLGLHASGTRQAGVLVWALGGFLFGIGYLVGHLLLTLELPVPGWIAATLANTLIAAAHVLILAGVQRYLGYRPWAVWVLVLLVVMFAIEMWQPMLRDSLRLRIIVHSGLYIAMDALAGIMLWRAAMPGLTVFRRAAAGVLLAYALFLTVRLIYAIFSTGMTTSFVQDPFQVLAFLVSMVFGFVMTMALVLMIFREKELHMRDIARRDPLTGLRNRYALKEISQREFATAAADGRPLSLLAMDLDHFKAVNDRFGHNGGDEVLKGVTRGLVDELRPQDLVFRVGGEEFLMLLPDTSEREATRVAERLREIIENSDWISGDQRIRTTASFGAIEIRPAEESWEDALLRADHALYRAKGAGRNRVVTGKDSATKAHDSHKVMSCSV